MNKKGKIALYLTLTLIVLLCAFQPVLSGLVSKQYTFVPGKVVYSSQVNANFDDLFNLANGGLDNANIDAAAGIVDTKLATISTANKVSETSFVCASDWLQLTDCDASAVNADTQHIHDGANITFSDSDFTATDLTDAVTELSSFTGYSSGTSGTISPSYFISFASTTYYSGFTLGLGSTDATSTYALTATDTASLSGVIYDISADIEVNGTPASPAWGYGVVGLYMQTGGATQTLEYPFIMNTIADGRIRQNSFKKLNFNFSEYGFSAGATGTLVVGFHGYGTTVQGNGWLNGIQVTTNGYK